MNADQANESLVIDLTHKASATLQKLASESSQIALTPGWQSRRAESDMNGLVWHFNHNAPHAREGETIEQTLETIPRYRTWVELWRIVRSAMAQPELRLARAYVNAYPFGTEALTHNDSTEPNELTVLIPAHTNWHHDWAEKQC